MCYMGRGECSLGQPAERGERGKEGERGERGSIGMDVIEDLTLRMKFNSHKRRKSYKLNTSYF